MMTAPCRPTPMRTLPARPSALLLAVLSGVLAGVWLLPVAARAAEAAPAAEAAEEADAAEAPAGGSMEEHLEDIVDEMTVAAARLQMQLDAGKKTRDHQQAALVSLDKVIEEVKKQQQQGQGQGKPSQGDSNSQAQQKPKPGQQPGQGQGEKPGQGQGGEQGGPEGQRSGGEPTSLDDLRASSAWGAHLPARVREEMAQSLGESFDPLYRKATEAYYRRLAELSSRKPQ